ncbi:hypothetical protein TNIN_99861 [Trichonephila inaurata madagascariensis]|uniref:Uncharacterized protein n=1 Tax=Trichonephila inaurata madagascariensis TaxID=2747483 RepID=A0A8X6YS44_9ARAC|nr:hypothetical protein TNIN_99861 [Trichonephila inaurata madagascariensis]
MSYLEYENSWGHNLTKSSSNYHFRLFVTTLEDIPGLSRNFSFFSGVVHYWLGSVKDTRVGTSMIFHIIQRNEFKPRHIGWMVFKTFGVCMHYASE